MKTIFYRTGFHDTHQAFFGIAVRRDQTPTRIDIVVINSPKLELAGSLWNTDEGRNFVLNKILATELLGIPKDSMRFFSLIDTRGDFGMHGLELPIRLDFADYKKKGNPYTGPSLLQRLLFRMGVGKLTAFYSNHHVVGGCANFYTKLDQGRHLSHEEMSELCAAVGYQRQREGIPDSVKNLFLEDAPPA